MKSTPGATGDATVESVPENQSGLWTETQLPEAAAAYRVLARKYRPTTFEQLIGQEAMVRTLSNAIEAGRLPHAWMLTGVRGIGKTTTARIIARALNCTGKDGKGGPTVHPCGTCDSCRAIADDRHVDVLEMDAASRTGVDDIRDIIDGVRYGPVSARYKIYILDEVHMLSKNAFNALLKTLEEPPPHTKFIFATTEIRKVPVTVLSRCQRFDLRRIASDELTRHFAQVAVWEQVTAEPEAIKLIAHAADGSVRDGLSLLDQAIARGNGAVTEGDVKDMLGLADRGQSLALARAILRGTIPQALDIFTAMQQVGSDPLQVLQDIAGLVHTLTRGQVITDFVRDPSLPEYDREFLVEMADIKIPVLARAWQILLKGITEVQQASHPAEAAEMVLIRLAYAAELPTPADLIKQLRDTKNTAPATTAAPPSPPSGSVMRVRSGGNVAVASAVATQALPQEETSLPQPTSYRELVALFAANREGTLHAQLSSDAHLVRFDPSGQLELRVGKSAPANFVGRIGQCLTTWTGQRWMVSVSDKEGEPSLAEQDQEVERQRHERATAHPLMQAVIKTFPGAKLTGLRQKAVVPVAIVTESSGNEASDDIMFEDETE
jgi:DNA polymerase-3 subunit gamma/tau